MKRFKSILFVYDGEKESGIALKRAITLTRENEATLTVVEVLEEFPSETQMAVQSSRIVDFQKTVEEDSRRYLRNVTEPIEKILHKLECSVLAIKPEGFQTPVKLDE